MVGHDTVVVQDNLNNSQQGAEVEKLEREEDQLKKEEKEEETLDVIGRQSVQTGAVGQPNGQAKKATEANKDQALLAQSVTNQQVAGTGSSQVRSEIKQTLESTGKFGKKPDDVNYTAMKEGLKKLDVQLNEPVKKENMLVGWRNLKKTYIWIASAAHQYVNTHKTAFSFSGISRKRHARALLQLCRSDMKRLDMVIQRPDKIEPQATWTQLLDKKTANANDSKLSVKNLADNKYTGSAMNDIVVTAGFGVMTKEEFMATSGLSVDQIPEKYRNIPSLLDTYIGKLTLAPAGKMQQNDDSRAILKQILELTEEYVQDIRDHKAASAGNVNPKLVFAMNTLQSQCNKILNPKSNVAASTPTNRLHGSLSMPGKVNEEIELKDLLTDKTQKDKPQKADPQAAAVVKEAPKKVMPQPEAPKKVTPQPEAQKREVPKEAPKEAPKVGNQAVPAQNVTVQMGAGTGNGIFSKVKPAVDFAKLPKKYQSLGTLIEEYGNLENSRQGGDALKAKLKDIFTRSMEYLQDNTIEEGSRELRIGTIKEIARTTINRIDRGENVLPQNEQQVPRRTSGRLSMPPKPVVQKTPPPLPPKPVAQKTPPPLPPKPVAQTQQPVPPEPVVQKQQEEQPKPVVQEQQEEQPKPVVQEQQEDQPKPVVQKQQEDQPKPVVQETQQTQEDQQQQEENTAEGTQQQEEPPQQQTQTPEPTGPSMRKEFLDMMNAAVETGDRLINPGYKAIIKRFEQLNTLLGEPITEANQKESWKKLQEAYGWLAAASGQYAKAHAAASTPLARECRRHARMLLFMCKADMNTLRIAIRDKELAKKNMTWRQILEQPAAPATQQTQTQQTEAQDAVQTNQPKGNPARDFRNLEQQLSGSAKGGIGWNSKYYNRVKAALEQTAKAMEKGFGHVAAENIETLKAACAALQELLDACKQYAARNPRTKNGKARRDIVLQIQDYAEKDLRGCGSKLFEFYSMSPDDQSKETWQSVLGGSRTEQLTVADYSKLEPAKGGQASEVFKIESQVDAKTVTKYFKKEDSLNLDVIKEKGEDAPFYFALQETLDKYPGLKEKDKKLLEELKYNGNVGSIDFSEEGVLAAQFCRQRWGQLREVITNLMESLGITEEDGMANMSRRNVATSRIAELLGLENLVAKSRTVDILDQATGQTIRGNLMDQAEGKEYSEVENLIQENKITSGFLRDVTNLQVLDMLCGQVDRHAKNMLYKIDEGKVTGVQGIDNDGAFGTNTDVTSAKNRYRKDLRVFDPNTLEMIIPYMDDELATRISELDENVVGYVLKDLLTDEEIEAVGKRLRILKDGISKARETQKDRFLTKDQWTVRGNDKDTNKKTVEEEMLDRHDYYAAMEEMNSDVFKQRVKDLATVRYKNDPETLRAIILIIDDKDKFQNDYEFKERQKFISAKAIIDQEVKMEFLTKYLANRNYFGRIVRNQM